VSEIAFVPAVFCLVLISANKKWCKIPSDEMPDCLWLFFYATKMLKLKLMPKLRHLLKTDKIKPVDAKFQLKNTEHAHFLPITYYQLDTQMEMNI